MRMDGSTNQFWGSGNQFSTGFGNDENLYPLVICYIVIEHGPSIVDLPIINDAFP
jgi:hypothetical protein